MLRYAFTLAILRHSRLFEHVHSSSMV
jgi:hypothetical protein